MPISSPTRRKSRLNMPLPATISAVSLLLLAVIPSIALQDKPIRQADFEVVYEWALMNFTWPSDEAFQEALDSGSYVPENVAYSGIKVYEDRVFVTTPRWKQGVPATLNVIDPATSLLTPWPSWEMQQIGNCSALQSVQSMEIDPYGRMWIIDTGTVRYPAEDLYPDPCPAKLLIVFVETAEILHTYEFPDEVAAIGKNYLNDIVLDFNSPIDTYAYMSDPDAPAVYVYSMEQDAAWKAYHPSMEADPEASNIEILGEEYTIKGGINGIALTHSSFENDPRLYYSPLQGYDLFSVSALALRSRELATNTELLDEYVLYEGRKTSQSGGMTVSSNGILYFGLLNSFGVGQFSVSDGLNGISVVAQDETLEWVDSFAFGSVDDGHLWLSANRLNRFLAGVVDPTQINYRVVRIYVGAGSYMESG